MFTPGNTGGLYFITAQRKPLELIVMSSWYHRDRDGLLTRESWETSGSLLLNFSIFSHTDEFSLCRAGHIVSWRHLKLISGASAKLVFSEVMNVNSTWQDVNELNRFLCAFLSVGSRKRPQSH